MNLLVEHNPANFAENVKLFATQVDNPDYLNLFISGLSISGQTEMVNTICDKLRIALETLDKRKFIQPILTAHVRKSPPELEDAMKVIQKLKAEESHDSAESALKYVIFLADAEKLFDVALGMYDFPLVIMVAQHSHKDPRDYIAFLSKLQKLPYYYQRFTIDDHLNKPTDALKNLCNAVDAEGKSFEEVVVYVKKYGLFYEAVDLFRDEKNPNQWKVIATVAADAFEERGELKEAATYYLYAGEKLKAVQAFAKALMWRETFALSQEIGISENKIKIIAEGIIVLLEDERRFDEAAIVALDYVDDIENSVRFLLKGGFWMEASRIVRLQKKDKMIKDVVIPGLFNAFDNLVEEMKSSKESLENHKTGLRRALEEKSRRQAQVELLETDERLNDIEVASDTSSMATTRITTQGSRNTISSHRSARTSKQRRKMDRKRAAGAHFEFEDEFHLNSVHKLVARMKHID
ncbi:hypothetical protein HK096_004723, partial [Nowakowskiella sp. JEL0078]